MLDLFFYIGVPGCGKFQVKQALFYFIGLKFAYIHFPDIQVVGPIRNTEWAAIEWLPLVAKAGPTTMALVTHATSLAFVDVS